MDHLDKGTLDLSELKYLVLDEADEMLKMGFAEDVETILADTPDTKQVALFSATMPARDPAHVAAVPARPRRDHRQDQDHDVGDDHAALPRRLVQQKIDALTRILEVENFEAMIVFARTKSATEEIAEKLRARGYSAAAINGDVAQAQRERTVNQLQVGQARHPRGDRRRRPRPRRRAHLARRQLRHPDRHRVVRAPHRAHGSRRPYGRRDQLRDAARARCSCARSSGRRVSRSPRCRCRASTTSTSRASPASTTRITAALGQTERIDGSATSSLTTSRHHDVPEVDVAAALAVVAQGESPLLLEPEPRARRAARRRLGDRGKRPGGCDRDRDERERRLAGARRAMATYRIAVGKRHRVEPRQIVGALANEGGL